MRLMHPLAVLLTLLLIVAVALVLYDYLPIADSLTKTRPLVAAAQAYEQSPANPTMRILVIGDSTAVGVGATPETSVAGRLGREFPNALIVNDSKSGRKLDEFLERLRARAQERYDLIVFQIGANDIVQRTPEKRVEELLGEALGIAETMAPHTLVMCAGNVGLAPVFKWPLSSLYTARSRSVLTRYQHRIMAYPEMRYVDLYNERKDEVFNMDIEKYYAADRFHPTGDGYGVWYEKLRGQIVSVGLLAA